MQTHKFFLPVILIKNFIRNQPLSAELAQISFSKIPKFKFTRNKSADLWLFLELMRLP